MVASGGILERDLLRKKLFEEFGERAKDNLWATLDVRETGGGLRQLPTLPEYETRDYVIPPNCRVIDDDISFTDKVLFMRRLPIAFRSNVYEAANLHERVHGLREHLRILNHIYTLPLDDAADTSTAASGPDITNRRLLRNLYSELRLPHSQGGIAFVTRSVDRMEVLPSSIGEARFMSDLATLERLKDKVDELEAEMKPDDGSRIELSGTCRNLLSFLELIENPKRLEVISKTFSNLRVVQSDTAADEKEGDDSHTMEMSNNLAIELQEDELRRIEILYTNLERSMGVATTEDYTLLGDSVDDKCVDEMAKLGKRLRIIEECMAEVTMQYGEVDKMITKMQKALEDQHASLEYLVGKCAAV